MSKIFHMVFIQPQYKTCYADFLKMPVKQGVALTGRNTTGPPSRAVPLHMRRLGMLQTTDDDDRRQRAKQYCPLHYV